MFALQFVSGFLVKLFNIFLPRSCFVFCLELFICSFCDFVLFPLLRPLFLFFGRCSVLYSVRFSVLSAVFQSELLRALGGRVAEREREVARYVN